MEFKQWLEGKILGDITRQDLDEISEEVQYIGTHSSVLEKVYNLFNDTDILDYIDIYTLKDERFGYMVTISNKLIDPCVLFDTIRFLNNDQLFKNLTKENMNALFLNDCNDYDNFYVLLSLDPNVYSLDYIHKVEKLLNGNITNPTNIDLLYEEFTNLLNSNSEFRLTITTNSCNFGMLGFDDLNEYNGYITSRNEYFRDISKTLLSNIQNMLPEGTDVHAFGTLDEVTEFMKQMEEEDGPILN